jgi:hypothetical protein
MFRPRERRVERMWRASGRMGSVVAKRAERVNEVAFEDDGGMGRRARRAILFPAAFQVDVRSE